MTQAAAEVVNTFFQSLTKGDAAGVAGCFAEDATVWTPGDTWFSGDHTLADVQKLSARILALFENGIRMEVDAITREGERIAVEAHSEGVRKDGRVYANRYHMLFIVRDEKIVHLREYMDTKIAADFLGQDAPPEL